MQLFAPQLQVCDNAAPASAAPLYNNAAHGDADAAHLNFHREHVDAWRRGGEETGRRGAER